MKAADRPIRSFGWADLAFLPQLRHGGPALFDVLIRLRPMHLVEVDAEPPRAGFALRPHRTGLEALADLTLLVSCAGALGEDIGTGRDSLDRAGDHFLGMAEAVDGGGVDPIHAFIESRADSRDGLVVVLRSLGEGPATASHGPGADPDGRDLQVADAEFFLGHRNYYRQRGEGRGLTPSPDATRPLC